MSEFFLNELWPDEGDWEDDDNTIWVKCSKCETEYEDLKYCNIHICPNCDHRENWDDIS